MEHSDTIDIRPQVSSITIEQGLASLKLDSIDAVHLLHYKTVDLRRLFGDAWVPENAVDYSRTAEIAIFYGSQHLSNQEVADEMVRTALECKFSCLMAYTFPAAEAFVFMANLLGSDAIDKTQARRW